MQYKINTYPDNIYAYIYVFWLLDSYSQCACGKCLSVHLLSYDQKSKQKIDADFYSTHYTYKYIHANYKQSIIKQISKSTQNTFKICMHF
jgi:hypothetical protein